MLIHNHDSQGEGSPLPDDSNRGGNTAEGSNALHHEKEALKQVHAAIARGDSAGALELASRFPNREALIAAESLVGPPQLENGRSVLTILDEYCLGAVKATYVRELAKLGLEANWLVDSLHLTEVGWDPAKNGEWVKNTASLLAGIRIKEAIDLGTAALQVSYRSPVMLMQAAGQFDEAVAYGDLPAALTLADRLGSRGDILALEAPPSGTGADVRGTTHLGGLDALCTDYLLDQVNALLATQGHPKRTHVTLGAAVIWTPGLTLGAIRQQAAALVSQIA